MKTMRLSKESLPILEEFATIQGEGVNLGKPYYFIRVGGCPLRCTNCDSEYTWKIDKKSIKLIEDIADRAIEICKENNIQWVSVTGGEPLIYPGQMVELMKLLQHAGLLVHIETSGRFHNEEVHLLCDIYSVDAKTPCTNETMDGYLLGIENLRPADQVKCLIDSWADIDYAYKLNQDLNARCTMVLQPFNTSPKTNNLIEIRNSIGMKFYDLVQMFHKSQSKRYKWRNVILTPQVHVLAYGNKPGV